MGKTIKTTFPNINNHSFSYDNKISTKPFKAQSMSFNKSSKQSFHAFDRLANISSFITKRTKTFNSKNDDPLNNFNFQTISEKVQPKNKTSSVNYYNLNKKAPMYENDVLGKTAYIKADKILPTGFSPPSLNKNIPLVKTPKINKNKSSPTNT